MKEQRLIEIVEGYLFEQDGGTTMTTVTLESSFEDLGLDSLETIELLKAVESQFGRVPDAAIKHIYSVGDILKALP